jgi:hypothetical protein
LSSDTDGGWRLPARSPASRWHSRNTALRRRAQPSLVRRLAEPSSGYVGQIKVSPAHGPVGTTVKVTGEGFAGIRSRLGHRDGQLEGFECRVFRP